MGEPDDWEEPSEPEPCDCVDYDVDILTGRAHCYCCGRAWWLTSEELAREITAQAECYEAMAEEFEAADKR